MNTVNVKIDISTPKGIKLLHDLKDLKYVEIENFPQPEPVEKMYTLEEAYEEAMIMLKKLYEKE